VVDEDEMIIFRTRSRCVVSSLLCCVVLLGYRSHVKRLFMRLTCRIILTYSAHCTMAFYYSCLAIFAANTQNLLGVANTLFVD
jgi:hypothetical protein